jgi:hypothetical protein
MVGMELVVGIALLVGLALLVGSSLWFISVMASPV